MAKTKSKKTAKTKATKAKKTKKAKAVDVPAGILRARAYTEWEAPLDDEGFPNVNKLFEWNNQPEKATKFKGRKLKQVEFIDHINATVFAQVFGVPLKRKVAKMLIEGYSDQMLRIAARGGKIGIPNIGNLQKVNRKARMGRNPMTGEQIKIPAKKAVSLRPSKVAKDFIMANG